MGSDVNSRMATLTPGQQALLRERLAGAGSHSAPVGDAMLEPARAELSFGQQRLWFLHQLDDSGPLYNVTRAWWLNGFLSVDRLRDAFAQLVARHSSLRTAFRSEAGTPWQEVLPVVPVELPVIDFSSSPLEVARQEALKHAKVLAGQPFDLEQAPLVRLHLLRAGPSTHLLVLVMQHIVSDGWSLAVFYRELSAFYAGNGAALPALPIQYVDYSRWQRTELATTLEPQLAHWRTKLANLSPLELPTDRPRPPHQSHRGTKWRRVFPAALGAALKQVCRGQRVTLFMLLLGAFQVLLSRYTRQDDIAVGSPIAGRMRGEFEGLIGFFVNTIVLRTDLSGNPQFTEVLRRVRDTALDAYANQNVPFDRLVDELGSTRDASRNPLVQSVFVLQNMPKADVALPGIDVTLQDLDTDTAKFDLTVQVYDVPDGLRTVWEYSTDLFDAGTIERMAGHFQRILETIAADPAVRLNDLPLLTRAEHQQVVVDWNRTETPFPAGRGLASLVEEQAASAPDAVAIVDGSHHVTYTALNTRANQYAHHLRSLGVVPGDVVAVALDRGSDMVTTFLAILKVGACYLPLEPEQPFERSALILKEAGASTLVTDTRWFAKFKGSSLRTVRLDADRATIQRQSTANLSVPVTGDDRAYVMYTSGSTGIPKGVAVPHKAISRLVVNTNYVTLTAKDVIAQASNCSFDAATFEIWGALLNGGRLAIVPRDILLSPAGLSSAIAQHGITTMFVTTTLFNRLAADAPSTFRGIRQLLVGGEAVDVVPMRRVLEASAPEKLINGYGPTEATTFAVTYCVESIAPDQSTIPIGRPISNTTVYLLDAFGHPCPVGIPGELHIGGPGVADGYVNQPELTADRFIPDPFSSQPGARLYRTGDLAKYRPDGNIEYLGRLDGQVKLRGFRVELGEIEAALRQHSHVSQAAVIVRKDTSGDKRLVAYVVATGITGSLTAEFRRFLGEKLPHYMVPATFIAIDALPISANGKLDRDALPEPPEARPDLDTPFNEPTTDVERTLTAIWEDVLNTRPIGINDDFFDLGGNSLLALPLIDRIARECHVQLPPVVLFEAPTIAQLGMLLHVTTEPAPGSPLVAIQPEGPLPPLFCVHGGGGHVLGYAELARHLGQDQPVYGLQAIGLDGQRVPHLDLKAMAAEYVREITRLRPKGPYHLTGLSFGGIVAFEMACQLEEQGHRVGLLAVLDSSRPGHLQLLTTGERIDNFARRFRYHATNVVLGPNRLDYTRRKVFTLRRRARERLWRLVSKPFRATGRELPPALRRVAEANRTALANYVARPYGGRLTLFIARTREITLNRLLDLGWGPYALGGVETYEVDGDHSNLVTEPYVRDLAEHLRRSLARAN